MRKALLAAGLVLVVLQVLVNSMWDIALGLGLLALMAAK